MSAHTLKGYLDANGILLINSSPDLPALDDIGCTWQDMTELIEARELFFCKAFKRRTTLLSREAYFLLRSLAGGAMPEGDAAVLLGLLDCPMTSRQLKLASALDKKRCDAALTSLLCDVRATCVHGGRRLSDSWSELVYGGAGLWERGALPVCTDGAKEKLYALLSPVMADADILRLMRIK